MSAFTQLASGIYLEGLAVDSTRNMVWCSDVVAGGIHGIQAGEERWLLDPERQWSGGVMMNEDGAVLSSGAGGIRWNRPESGESGWLINEIDGVPVNGINEMFPDGEGGLIFGTCDIESVIAGQQTRPTAIYRLTADRHLKLLAEDINFSNGLVLSPDRSKLYCNDTFTGTWVFDVASDFSLSNRHLLIEKPDADGMAIDGEGNIWITGFQSGHVVRLRPDGTALPPFEPPAGAITQIRFGGSDLRDLYINTVPTDGGENLKDGKPIETRNSHLYLTRSDIAGAAIPAVRFTL